MDAGAHDEGAAVADLALAAADRLLVERRNRQVPMDVAEVFQPQRLESEFGNDEARLVTAFLLFIVDSERMANGRLP